MDLPKRLYQPRSRYPSFYVVLYPVLLLNFESEASSQNASWQSEEADSNDGENTRDELSHAS